MAAPDFSNVLAPKGKPGSGFALCACSNHIGKFSPPEWIGRRDFTPTAPVADDALVSHARSRRGGVNP